MERLAIYQNSTGLWLMNHPTEDDPDFALYFKTSLADYEITKNDYFDRSQPAKSEELVNRVSVPVTALTPGSAGELYRSAAAVSIAAGASVTISAEYSSSPAKTVSAALSGAGAGISITASGLYAASAEITVTAAGAAGTFVLVITGTPLEENADEVITAEDTAAQLENGLLKYDLPKNHLVQSATIAGKIAASLLNSYKTPRKDCIISWRGDPALELGDLFEAPEYQRGAIDERADFYVYKNKLEFDGTLRASTEGRKI